MTSQEFRAIEDRVGVLLIVQDELVAALATKLEQPKMVIERALYSTSVAVGMRPLDSASCIYEFLIALKEGQEKEV